MSKTYAVPPASPHNEGKTVAAWVMTVGVVLGSTIAAFGIALLQMPIVLVGAAVVVLAVIVSTVLHFAGLGQPREKARAR